MKSNSKKYRIYGHQSPIIAILHGGPGIPGSIAPVARKLSEKYSIIEPFQTQDTVKGQLEELGQIIDDKCIVPVILIGHSWGAWLAYLFSANYPEKVKKLILISAGSFKEHYASKILNIRLSRLSDDDQRKVHMLLETMKCKQHKTDPAILKQFGRFMSLADAYEKIYEENEIVEYQPEIFYKVWGEAVKLRRTGKLLKFGEKIACPVVAIHGDYDPHPADGVKLPLSRVINDFTFILLEKCGHEPWNERFAKENFYNILTKQVNL